MTTKGSMTVADAGRRGGRMTKLRHPDQYAVIGKLGGDTTKRRHGPEHYRRIGRKGGNRVKALVAAGKAAERGRKR